MKYLKFLAELIQSFFYLIKLKLGIVHKLEIAEKVKAIKQLKKKKRKPLTMEQRREIEEKRLLNKALKNGRKSYATTKGFALT